MTAPSFDALVEALEASTGLPVPTPQEFAARVVQQLDARGFEVVAQRPSPAPCAAETWSWDHFNSEQVDGYWIRCTLQGTHDDHQDEHTGLAWTATAPNRGDAR